MAEVIDYYKTLGISKSASNLEVKRAYRRLVTLNHPDKGGDAAKFGNIRKAYEVLVDGVKREEYDQRGRVEKSIEEEFSENFGGGSFKYNFRGAANEAAESLADKLAVWQKSDQGSHTAGFEAFLRSRGDLVNRSFNVDDAISQFGVHKESYEAVQLPSIKAHKVMCTSLGPATDVTSIDAEPIPKALEWGEVLVNIKAAPINPADTYTILVGGAGLLLEGEIPVNTPFVAGSDAVGVVAKVGPGCKALSENDWVIPAKVNMGTWTSLAVWKEEDCLKIPAELVPIEYAAVLRELCLGYRLLEDFGKLKPGDGVVLNAATGAVGQVLIQLCNLLKLSAIAVTRDSENFDATAEWLKRLGAKEVMRDGPNLKHELQKRRFLSKPKLALDAVGGYASGYLADMLADGGTLVIYGGMSGKGLQFPWQYWVTKDIMVRGFSLRRWMRNPKNKDKMDHMFDQLAKLVNTENVKLEYSEYELSTEFKDALEHALEDGRNTKVILKVNDIGITYDDE